LTTLASFNFLVSSLPAAPHNNRIFVLPDEVALSLPPSNIRDLPRMQNPVTYGNLFGANL